MVQLFSAILLALTLACGVIPISQPTPDIRNSSSSSTPTLQFVDILPPNAPTPISTEIPSQINSAYIGAEITNSSGKASIVNQDLVLTITVEDNSTHDPVNEIQIQAYLVDDNTKILVVALDPSRKYFPLVQTVENTVSKVNGTNTPFGVSLARAQITVEIALMLQKVVDAINTGMSIYDLFSDLPDRVHIQISLQ